MAHWNFLLVFSWTNDTWLAKVILRAKAFAPESEEKKLKEKNHSDKLYYSQFDQRVLIQSCSAGAKNFTNYIFCHVQFSAVIQNIANHRAIITKFWKTDFYYIKLIILIIIDIDK